ncbi:nonribosomal peptide synthase Pes1 [Sclerotinia borealis F-4128]|uniref:Nonribosomal peptide synthase Pes1 n=1 Tax=Sclerotinia borealis (strain F-4128) TaxID=1432307 RepID=W9C0K1_SCLBF|nr:nonribosomal peptide synthase Pes1 [Sclerotinia borealis F-4128]
MKRILAQLDYVLQQLAQEFDVRLADVEIISPSYFLEIQEWNKTIPPIVDECMHILIQNQVTARREADAVVSWDGRYTYTELGDVTSRLAHRLVSLGVGPEVVVPLFFEKSIYTVVSMLAVQKAGGAFVSLDLTAPGARLHSLIEATGAKLVLGCQFQAHKIEGKIPSLLIVDGALIGSLPQSPRALETGVTPDNAAYLLFTSGSTGTPKGIIIEHRAMNMLGVNHAFLTPTVGSLLKPDDVPNLKVLKLGGEALTRENLALWASRVRLSNSYGVAERAIRSAFKNYLMPEDNFANLGKAVGCALWITNPADHNKLSPIGSIGELLIEGSTLARGYLADVAKTESSFVKAPKWLKFAFPGRSERVYKTGDLVRYCYDGSLEFVGRSDTQVKLRGQRIDLREIEHFLNATPDVRLASVLIPTSGEFSGNLVAIISLNAYLEEKSITDLNSIQLLPSDWRRTAAESFTKCDDFLAENLPTYMLPNAWIAVELIPILQSGKMNRKKLLNWVEDMEKDVAHNVKMIRINEDVDAGPMVQRELEIRSIFGYVLNIPEASLGPKTSFFRIGGDSISAMQIMTLCRAKGIQLTMQDIPIHKTIARLATSTTADSQSSLDLSTLTEEYGVPHQLSPIQTMFFDLMPDGNNLYDQSFYLKLKFNLSPKRISDAVTTITRRHSMLRAVFSKSGDGSWVQTIRPPEEKVHSFQSYDISRPQDALSVIDKSRKLVDFEKGLTFALS